MSTVIIPFRSDDGPRERACTKVRLHLTEAGLRWILFPAEPWSPGAARNLGAELTSDDVLVFNDADTIVPAGQIREAVQAAGDEPGLVYAYTLYVRRDRSGRPVREIFGSPSLGCAAISRESFEQVGGFDESYIGWGYEDCDFARRCSERWPLRRVEGVAWHLWHGDRRGDDAPEDSDPDDVRANLERWQRAASTV